MPLANCLWATKQFEIRLIDADNKCDAIAVRLESARQTNDGFMNYSIWFAKHYQLQMYE